MVSLYLLPVFGYRSRKWTFASRNNGLYCCRCEWLWITYV